MNGSRTKQLCCLIVAVLCVGRGAPAPAQEEKTPVPQVNPATVKSDRAEPVPEELEGVGVDEKLGGKIPLDAVFTDSEGRKVKLSEVLDGDKPVILNLGYFGCPMLCGLVIDGLVAAMQESTLKPGEDYEVLTVSIDPSETAVLARLGKQKAIQDLGRAEAAAGWHFLTGDEKNIARLTEAVGFKFKWNDRRKEFAHAAALVVLTPDGAISRYLYGILFPQKTFRLSLVEASAGTIGTTLDQLILYCFHYDASEGQYTPAAMNLMRLGGGMTVLVLGGAIAIALLRERRKAALRAAAIGAESRG